MIHTSIEDREEQIDKLTEDILTRKTDDIKKWLIEVSENSEIDNDVRTARSLFSRLEEAERIFISDETNVSFYAAECMAEGAWQLVTKPEILNAAWDEFRKTE